MTGGQGLEPRSPGPKPGVSASWTTPQGSIASLTIHESTNGCGGVRRRFRPRRMRTYVRHATVSALYGTAGESSGRGVAQPDCGAPALRPEARRREPPDTQEADRAIWHPTEHFHKNWVLRGPRPSRTIPLDEVLVENSFYNRTKLKARLYEAGLRERQCQLCGQGERWNGRGMSLILDHINGVAIDNRLENLRIVCPNCAATLDTHCGRKNRLDRGPRSCLHCGNAFHRKYATHRYCSHACGVHSKGRRKPRPERCEVERPSMSS